ncbi:MAG: hypothetical protein AAF982_02975 [Pseudomonadota bacterium]
MRFEQRPRSLDDLIERGYPNDRIATVIDRAAQFVRQIDFQRDPGIGQAIR